MKQPFLKAFNELKRIGAPVFTNKDNDRLGNFSISAEENYPEPWAEYYNQGWGLFGVSPRITAVLDKHGLFAEWEDPGKLNVYQ